jgi:hypothetical protein
MRKCPGYNRVPRLRCESCILATQASVEALVLSEGYDPNEGL